MRRGVCPRSTGRGRWARQGGRRDALEHELIDFIESRGRFAVRGEYVGKDASSIPALFVEHFDGLGETQKTEMARMLAAGVLGESEALCPYMAPAMRLMGHLCLHHHGGYFHGSREALEKAFTDPTNVKVWLEAPDLDTEGQGPAFHKEWRYALALWGGALPPRLR